MMACIMNCIFAVKLKVKIKGIFFGFQRTWASQDLIILYLSVKSIIAQQSASLLCINVKTFLFSLDLGITVFNHFAPLSKTVCRNELLRD